VSNTDTNIDYAAEEVSRLSKDYAELGNSVAGVLARLRDLPKTIEDEATLDRYAVLIREGRDLTKRIEGYHDMEKQPFLRRGQGVDNFFFGLWGKVARRPGRKHDAAGGIDIADARVDDYMQRKLAAERAERERVAAEERRKAEAAAAAERAERERAEIERRKAAEAAERAERARKEANAEVQRKAEEEARAAAEEADRAAEKHAAAAAYAEQQAEDARIDAAAPAADLVRTRTESGAMATMATVPYVKIDDVTKLDKEALWPFLKEDHIDMALKAWAKTKSHRTPMEGATIKLVPKGQVR